MLAVLYKAWLMLRFSEAAPEKPIQLFFAACLPREGRCASCLLCSQVKTAYKWQIRPTPPFKRGFIAWDFQPLEKKTANKSTAARLEGGLINKYLLLKIKNEGFSNKFKNDG